MCPVSGRNILLPRRNRLTGSEKGIEDRDPKGQKGNEDGGADLAFGGMDNGYAGDDVAEEITPAVAHEDGGGIEIVSQEAQTGPRKAAKKESVRVIFPPDGDGGHDRRGEKGNARSKTVKAVGEVQGIDEEDEPENRNDVARNTKWPTELKAEKIGNVSSPEVSDGGGEHLETQFYGRLGPVKIVEKADAKDNKRPYKEHCHPSIQCDPCFRKAEKEMGDNKRQ